MTTFYNRIAGQNLDRLSALSDGVFAVAMTLLVLDLRAPAAALVHDERALWTALASDIAPRLLTYLMSFLTLGIFWIGQQTQHHFLAKSERAYAWINIVFLMAITLIPFSTALLAEFITYRVALLVYWLNILFIGLLVWLCWRHARKAGLVRQDAPADIDSAILRRVFAGQALYALGAALCIFSTYWSIGFIVAVQIQYAVGPRLRPFGWL